MTSPIGLWPSFFFFFFNGANSDYIWMKASSLGGYLDWIGPRAGRARRGSNLNNRVSQDGNRHSCLWGWENWQLISSCKTFLRTILEPHYYSQWLFFFFMILFTLIIHRMGEIQHLNRLEQTILMKCYEGRSPLLSTKTHCDITH